MGKKKDVVWTNFELVEKCDGQVLVSSHQHPGHLAKFLKDYPHDAIIGYRWTTYDGFATPQEIADVNFTPKPMAYGTYGDISVLEAGTLQSAGLRVLKSTTTKEAT